MSLFSFLRKNKQESAPDDSAFYSRAEEESKAVRTRRKRNSTKQSDQGGNEPVDPVLPEKKRARRRLIGAVALVLAAIIGLPMILDSEPKPIADDIAIQIPSKDKPAPAPSSGTSRPAGNTQPVKITTEATLDAKEEVIDPPAIATTPRPTVPSKAGGAPADVAVALANSTPRQDEKPVADPAKAIAAEKPTARAEPKAEAKADTKPHAKAELKSESKPEIKADSKAADNKSREKQEEAARAKALLDGKAAPKANEKKSERFVIQVAALATKEKIDELQGKLKGAGIKSFTQKVATESGDRTRIRVGPFTNKDEADKIRAKIVKLGLNGTLVPLDS